MTPREGFRRWAVDYGSEQNPLRALAARVLGPWLAEVRRDERFLDAGCGDRLARPEAFGIDLVREMLSQAPSGRIAEATFEKPPFRSQTFDCVWASLSLSYAKRPAVAVAKLMELVRDGGRFVVCDLHPDAANWTRGPGIPSNPDALQISLEAGDGWIDEGRFESRFGEPEHELFRAAQRLDLWRLVKDTPALIAVRRRRLP